MGSNKFWRSTVVLEAANIFNVVAVAVVTVSDAVCCFFLLYLLFFFFFFFFFPEPTAWDAPNLPSGLELTFSPLVVVVHVQLF
jgi:hypothetical protein